METKESEVKFKRSALVGDVNGSTLSLCLLNSAAAPARISGLAVPTSCVTKLFLHLSVSQTSCILFLKVDIATSSFETLRAHFSAADLVLVS
jgi:hypothetical protein